MKIIIRYWPILLILILFVYVINFIMSVNKTEISCLNELKKYCNNMEEEKIVTFKKILMKNIFYYFVAHLIISILLGLFLFFQEEAINFLPICCIVIVISYLKAIIPLINIIRKKKTLFYKVDTDKVETKTEWFTSVGSDGGSYIRCNFNIRDNNEQYSTSNVILIFNNFFGFFMQKKSCLGECYIVDDRLLVKIVKNK